MDIFFFQLVVIFIPGIIWERMDTQYGRERAKEQWDVIRRSFIFGLFSYVTLFAISWCLSLKYGDLGIRMFQIKKDETFLDAGAFKEIFFASDRGFGLLNPLAVRHKLQIDHASLAGHQGN